MNEGAVEAAGRRASFEQLPMRVALATFVPPSAERLRFIKQLGVDDVILWGTTFGKASSTSEHEISLDELNALRRRIEDAGLRLFAVETLPAHFYDEIILGSEQRDKQIEHFKRSIQAVGRAGIPVFGYNWILDGVWRTTFSNTLRGGARGTAFREADTRDVPFTHNRDYTEEEFWGHYEHFVRQVIPVAEGEGVKLAIHPNDPPVEKIGGVPFLFRNFANFKRALEILPSDNHGLTFCLGCWSEMGADIVEMARHFGDLRKLFYVHFQAVRGSVPEFHETFIDEGDYGGHDAFEVLKTLKEVGFRGVMIPGHVPQIEGDIEWRTQESASHTPYTHPMGGFRARAYTIGYLKGMLRAIADC